MRLQSEELERMSWDHDRNSSSSWTAPVSNLCECEMETTAIVGLEVELEECPLSKEIVLRYL